MNWINLNVTVLDSPEFLGSEPVDRATWICLLRYCAGQENGGRIVGCGAWRDRQWQQLVRITLAEARTECDLWTWDGDDLVVNHYPADKETEVVNKRQASKENGKKGGRPPKEKPEFSPEKNPRETQEKPKENPAHNPGETQVESGKERKGKERNTPLPPEGDLFGGEVPDPPPARNAKTPSSPQALRIGAIMHRRPGTEWAENEIRAFRHLRINDADLEAVEAYYAAHWPPNHTDGDPKRNHLRSNLLTLLRNWTGEVDRAKRHASRSALRPIVT